MNNNIIIGKNIYVNGVENNIKIKWIEDEYKLCGYIGHCKFIWKYSKYLYPKLEKNNTVNNRRWAKDYIIETFKQNNIDYTEIIKISRLSKDSLFFDLKDNLWFSVYINGYVRGEIDGIEFVWDTKKYTNILLIRNGQYIGKMSSRRIIKRLKEEGYNNATELMDAIRTNKITLDNLTVELSFVDTNAFLAEGFKNTASLKENVEKPINAKPNAIDILNIDISIEELNLEVGNN